MNLRYAPSAILDLEEIRNYITDELLNPDAARNTLLRIVRDLGALKTQPRLGQTLRRKFGLDMDGYCIISGRQLAVYDINEAENTVEILRVLDTRTDYLRILLSSDKQ